MPIDEKNFLKGITIFAVDEIVLREGAGAAKVLLLMRESGDGNDVDDMRLWIDRLSLILPGLRRCVANRVLTSDHRPGVWHEAHPPSLIVELRFDRESDAETALQSEAYKSLAASAAHLGASAVAYLVDERVII